MAFESRRDAGRKLGLRLQELAVQVDVVAGLPRGGVVVAAEIADLLHAPLAGMVVRKIGHPWQREFAVGALAEDGVVILDKDVIAANPISRAELDAVIAEETSRLRQNCLKFHRGSAVQFAGRRVLLVDDGLATGATAEAAVQAVRNQQPREIIMAAPVASTHACERLTRIADSIVTLITDPDFAAVGQYYKKFPPASDEEVLALLHRQRADYRPTA